EGRVGRGRFGSRQFRVVERGPNKARSVTRKANCCSSRYRPARLAATAARASTGPVESALAWECPATQRYSVFSRSCPTLGKHRNRISGGRPDWNIPSSAADIPTEHHHARTGDTRPTQSCLSSGTCLCAAHNFGRLWHYPVGSHGSWPSSRGDRPLWQGGNSRRKWLHRSS